MRTSELIEKHELLYSRVKEELGEEGVEILNELLEVERDLTKLEN